MVAERAGPARCPSCRRQELGSKKEHLALAAAGRCKNFNRILMVGDALSNWRETARALPEHSSIPFLPSLEDGSVAAFLEEALPLFPKCPAIT